MTRINVGVHVHELCDQHLLAELRELPRAIGRHTLSSSPEKFKLGAGHVLWCAQFQESLRQRGKLLAAEAEVRGFNSLFTCVRQPYNARTWSRDDLLLARPLVIQRILERLTAMESAKFEHHRPRWTKRSRPAWAVF